MAKNVIQSLFIALAVLALLFALKYLGIAEFLDEGSFIEVLLLIALTISTLVLMTGVRNILSKSELRKRNSRKLMLEGAFGIGVCLFFLFI